MTDKEMLMIQMYSAQKKKKIIITVVIIAIIILGLCVSAFIVISSQIVQLKQQSVTVEYGTIYTPEVIDFIDEKNVGCVTSFNCDIPNEKDKQYAEVGEYDITIGLKVPIILNNNKLFDMSYNKTATVVINDTTPPVFNQDCPKELTVYTIDENENKPDISKYFTASDISGDCKIATKDEDIDYTTANKHNVEVVATDKNNNTTSLNVLLNVVASSLTVNPSQLTMYVGDKQKLNVECKNNNKPKFLSSMEDICTVDDEGNVTAKSKGYCTITVTVQNLVATCDVQVTEKEVEPTTQSDTEQSTKTTQQQSGNTTTKSKQQASKKTQSSGSKSSSKKKYPNKDFLFKDGYTMDNVTDAAYKYLKESGQPGRCIPLKDSDGVYYGMRVEFD
jgi:hypothetical protein